MTHDERMERVRRAIDGLSVGDAFGEQFFGPPGVMTARILARQVPTGRWRYTDDTEMALGIAEVLEGKRDIDQDLLADVFARRFRANRHRGYGGTAQDILERIGDGASWRHVSAHVFGGEGSQGNGAAMRAAPVGAYFFDDEAAVVTQARHSAEVTHAHPDGQAGAIAVALAAAWVLRNPGAVDGQAMLSWVTERTPEGATRASLVQAGALGSEAPAVVAERLGTGARVLSWDTVPFSLWSAARALGRFEEALWATVSGLGDRDTTCAIVGGIVALHENAVIPAAWLEAREQLGRTSAW